MLLVKAEPEWRQLHRIADSLAPDLRDAFLKAAEALRALLPVNTVTELLEAEAFGELGKLVAGLEMPKAAADTIRTVLAQAASRAATQTGISFGLSFTIDNPAVIRWIDSYVGRQIVGITQETQKAVAQIIRTGFVEGLAPRQQARLIRNVVGLTSRDAAAVAAFQQGMLENNAPLRLIDRGVKRMSARLLNRRALNIARTETIRASNQGQLIAWREAADQGLLDLDAVARVWIATDDDRTCPVCNALDGQVVGFSDGFSVAQAGRDTGRRVFADHDGQTPPAHVACRCAVGLESVETAEPIEREVGLGEALRLEDEIKATDRLYDQAAAQRGLSRQNARFDGPRLKEANAREIGQSLEDRLGRDRAKELADWFIGDDGIEWEPGEAGEYFADSVMRGWAETSTSDSFSVAAQRAAAEAHGIPWRPLASYDDSVFAGLGNTEISPDRIFAEIGDGLREFARIEYERTQIWLAGNGFDTIRLVRGVGDPNLPIGRGEATLNPLSSFSTNLDTATAFARDFEGKTETKGWGRVMIVDVPRHQIASTAFTGRGSFIEAEFVVIGDGPLEAIVGRPGTGATLSGELFVKARRFNVDRLAHNADWIKRRK